MRHSILGCILAFGLLALTFTGSTGAQTGTDMHPHVYIGGGVGYSRIEDQEFPEWDEEFEDEPEAYKAFIGTMLTPYFGLEAGYVDFAEASDCDVDADIDGITFAALGQIPLGEILALYGKGGILSWDIDVDAPLGSASHDGDDFFYGFGARLGVTTALGLRLEYERFELDDTDVDLASLNLEFRF